MSKSLISMDEQLGWRDATSPPPHRPAPHARRKERQPGLRRGAGRRRRLAADVAGAGQPEGEPSRLTAGDRRGDGGHGGNPPSSPQRHGHRRDPPPPPGSNQPP